MFYVEILVLVYVAYVSLYSFFFSVSGLLLYKPLAEHKNQKRNRIVAFIPSYKEDAVIVSTIENALLQDYPKEFLDIVVIADRLKKETLSKLRDFPIHVVEVFFENSTKTKSLNMALKDHFDYDIAVILDADNHMKHDFIGKINNAYNLGYRAIQGRRVAKNKNTPVAILDGISEAINNHISRKGPNAVGLSSSIIGSGMAFDLKLLKSHLSQIEAVGGFDKVLQNSLLNDGISIRYLADAVVYDEKVDNKEVFENQRTRWVKSHYKYLSQFFKHKVLKNFTNFSLLNIAILGPIQLPRIINLGLFALLATGFLIFPEYLELEIIGLVFIATYYLSVLICIPREYFNRQLVKAILNLPGTFFSMMLIHAKLKGKDKTFIHTPHRH